MCNKLSHGVILSASVLFAKLIIKIKIPNIMIDQIQNQNVQNAIVFNPSNPSQLIQDALQVPSVPTSVPSAPTQNKPSGFLKKMIISKVTTNKEGELRGGNQVGYEINFSNLNCLSNEQTNEIESKDRSASYHWDIFKKIEPTLKNLSPTEIGKALNEELKEEFGKIPKDGLEKNKRLTLSVKNRYINGFYNGVNALKNLAKGYRQEIEEREGLILTGMKVKNNGQSSSLYQRMRKTAENKGRSGTSILNESKQKKIEQLEQTNADLMARLEALEAKK